MNWTEDVALFLLGFSSLLPLINPVGTAMIVNPYFAGSSVRERRSHAFSICLACFGLGVATLFGGSWALKFMGISIPTTQMAGGLIIARMGLGLLSSDEGDKDQTSQGKIGGSLFYPIAFPLTLGPGGISTLITLSAHAHVDELAITLQRMLVLGVSLLATLVLTYFCFVYGNFLLERVGRSGSQVINRLMAFLVFCIGIQMIVGGLSHSFPGLFK